MNNTLSKLQNPNEQTVVAQTAYNAPNGNQFFGSVSAVNSTAIFVNGVNGQQQIQLSTDYCNLFIIRMRLCGANRLVSYARERRSIS